MPRFSAHYTCTKCGTARLQIERAADYRGALTTLPRWIYPAGHTMRRNSAPRIYKETDNK